MSKISIDLINLNSKHNTRTEDTKVTNLNFTDTGVSVEVEWGGFFLPNKRFNGKEKNIKIGDELTIYEYGGSAIRGIDINGENLFFLWDTEIDAEHEEWCAQYQKEKEETFEREKTKYDKQYESLPQCFKDRIDKFRKDNPKFRVDYEAYELFCCTEAILIAETLKTPEGVKEWADSDDRWAKVPDLDHGHSGNTMGASTQMAYWYLQQPEAINRIVGALSPLVGSREYEEKNKRRKLKEHESLD